MISRNGIKKLMEAGYIEVIPRPQFIGPNSIDLTLGHDLKMYEDFNGRVEVVDPIDGATYMAIDPSCPPGLRSVPKWRNDQWLLVPGRFYLGSTAETTYCRGVIPHLDGRSTAGRLSIEAHKTAGVGDNGFHGRWTLEIEVTEPVLVKPGDRLFQMYFSPAWSERFIEDALNATHAEGQPFEEYDLYGIDGRHHYQHSDTTKGPKSLD